MQLSPEFLSAIVGLARTHIEDATYKWSENRGLSLAEARRLLGAVFEINLDHALARAELAHTLMVEGEFRKGREEAMRAVAADPNLADAQHVVSTLLVCLGEHEEALQYIRRCLKLNPGSPDFYLISKTEALLGLQHFDEAQQVVQRVIARQPDWKMAHALAVIAYEGAGKHDEACAAATHLRSLSSRFSVSLWRSYLFFPDREDIPAFSMMLANAGLPE